MSAQILHGRTVALELRREAVESLKHLATLKFVPHLAVVAVGDYPDGRLYLAQKEKACRELGMILQKHQLPASARPGEALDLIRSLNADRSVHGILIQFPLPGSVDPDALMEALDPAKDVEGIHALNAGRLISGLPTVVPCTAGAIVKMLEYYGVEISGRRAVVVGRSSIVGKPAALMLLERNATVIVCHSQTHDLPELVRQGDIVVAAVGRPRFITADMVKPGAAVVDVGVNVAKEGLLGDVDFAPVAEKASWITPVPGGVGPVTVAMLMKNIVKVTGAFA